MKEGRDFWWHDLMAAAPAECPCEEMDAEDPLFILYTSGSTGKPKGVQHNVGGYMVYTGVTHKYVFDYHDGDIYCCAADIGWVTGHSYIIYGPLANGATTVMFESIPNYPDPGRYWQMIEEVEGQPVLHRADGDPRHRRRRRGVPGPLRHAEPAAARHRG